MADSEHPGTAGPGHSPAGTRTPARLPRSFWLLFAAMLANRLGSFVVPYLALYLTTDHGFSASTAGALLAGYGAGAVVASLLGGRLADGWGRRRTIVLSYLGSGGCAVVLALFPHPVVIVAATIGIGVLGEMFRPAALAAVADIVPAEDRTRAYGLLYWATNLGWATAMVLGGVVAQRGFTVAFLVDAATSLAAATVMGLWFRDAWRRPADASAGSARSGIVPRDPTLVAFVALAFVFFWIYSQALVTLPLALHEEGLSFSRYGLVMAVNGVTVVLLQGVVTRVVQKLPARSALAAGALLMGVGFGLYAFVSNVWQAGLAVLVWTVGEIVYSVVAPATLAGLAPAHMRGRYQGLFSASLTAATVVGPLGGGLLLQLGGSGTVWFVCVGAGLVTAVGYLALRVEPRPSAVAADPPAKVAGDRREAP
ncbi:MAG TPA: MFS transporter [Micromonosporaceae bacterium]|nr:MFS transporter [Micromonosporaceae bacterium]